MPKTAYDTTITDCATRWALVLSEELEQALPEMLALPNGPRQQALKTLLEQAQILRLAFLALGTGAGHVEAPRWSKKVPGGSS